MQSFVRFMTMIHKMQNHNEPSVHPAISNPPTHPLMLLINIGENSFDTDLGIFGVIFLCVANVIALGHFVGEKCGACRFGSEELRGVSLLFSPLTKGYNCTSREVVPGV